MYLWRRLATPKWWSENQETLRAQFGNKLAVIEQPNRKRLQIEVACESSHALKKFDGRAKKLSRDWLKQILRKQKTKPIKIGDRLLISNVGGTSASRVRAGPAISRRQGRCHIVIPAGAAFGTGTHATTAMSLRLLERVIRLWGAHAPARAGDGAPAIVNFKGAFRRRHRKEHARRVRSPELMVDLGTGTGILALAAKVLGAKRAIGLDIDPIAISTAKENARRNKIDNVTFQVADVRRWKPSPKSRHRRGYGGQVDIVTANLFSELLIEILPKLKRARWLILSGILREQEGDVVRALKRNKINVLEVRRRGKWVAVLATVS